MHTSDKDRTKWVCQYCNTSFSGSRTLRDHITILHATVKPQIPCPVKTCTKVFLTTKRLRAHIKVHDDDSKEQCNVCGLLVTNRHNLEKHVKRVHLKLRNFFCDVCGYSSTFKHSIASHMVRTRQLHPSYKMLINYSTGQSHRSKRATKVEMRLVQLCQRQRTVASSP